MSTHPAATMGIKSTPPCLSLSVTNGPAAGAATNLPPRDGRDYMNYSSLNGIQATGTVLGEITPRPLSSMENAAE
ncbi:hypothetical protein BGZ65_001841, partial [Modicella reniformis]